MNYYAVIPLLGGLAILAMGTLPGCGCGFDCDSDRNNPRVTSLDLALSDETVEELKEVVIEVDSITFGRSGGDDVVVDTFTIAEQGITDADSFQIDLLDYQGRNQLKVITALELDTATYNQVSLTFIDGDVNSSYVLQSDDTLKQITAPSGGLALPNLVLSEETEQLTIEFSLAQALQYRTASDDYLLANDGVRVEDTDEAASLSGRVDSSLFDSQAPCDEKTTPTAGNRIYLYQGVNLSGTLADVHTSDSSTTVPADAIAPFAVGTLAENALTGVVEYVFGYLPAGDYTLSFSCDAAADDPVEYNGIAVPLPQEQVYEIELSGGELATCDLEEGANCS